MKFAWKPSVFFHCHLDVISWLILGVSDTDGLFAAFPKDVVFHRTIV